MKDRVRRDHRFEDQPNQDRKRTSSLVAAEQPGCEEAARGALADFAERRIGGNHPASALMFSPGPIASTQTWISPPACAAEDRGTEDFTGFGRHRLQQAVGLALRLGAVVLVIGPAQDRDVVAVGRARLLFGEADMSELGIGIGHPGSERSRPWRAGGTAHCG